MALGEELASESARTTIKLMYRTPGASEENDEDEEEDEDEEKEKEDAEIETTVLCSLIPGKVNILHILNANPLVTCIYAID